MRLAAEGVAGGRALRLSGRAEKDASMRPTAPWVGGAGFGPAAVERAPTVAAHAKPKALAKANWFG